MNKANMNDTEHAMDMIRLYTDSIRLAKTPTLHVVQYKFWYTDNGNGRHKGGWRGNMSLCSSVKVFAAYETGGIMDITRYVAIIGNYVRRDDGCLIVGSPSEPVDTVAKFLGLQSLRTEVI